jgi:hypothetical protein
MMSRRFLFQGQKPTMKDGLIVSTKEGMKGVDERGLTRKSGEEFDLFLTGDRNLTFQQEAPSFKIAVAALHAESTSANAQSPCRAAHDIVWAGSQHFR